MSARDHNTTHYCLDDGLNDWGRRWVLEGNGIMCVSCGAGHAGRDADQPFAHVNTLSGARLASSCQVPVARAGRAAAQPPCRPNMSGRDGNNRNTFVWIRMAPTIGRNADPLQLHQAS